MHHRVCCILVWVENRGSINGLSKKARLGLALQTAVCLGIQLKHFIGKAVISLDTL